ncbi:MAG: tetratricopeptide repeat protein [Acidimicrobiales bacterium]
MSELDGGGRARGDLAERRWALEDQREFLERSLADLEAESEAGDLAVLDYGSLRARDTERLAEVKAELAALGESASKEPPVQRAPRASAKKRRVWLAILGVAALCGGATLLAVRLLAPSLPGQPVTGSVPATVTNLLAEASVLIDEGTPTSLTQALSVYAKVLTLAPDQPQALAETGWLEWEAGYLRNNRALETAGRSTVARALAADSHYSAPHLFMGTIALEQLKRPLAAVKHYEAFLKAKPPSDEVAAASSLIQRAFHEAHLPVPAAASGG